MERNIVINGFDNPAKNFGAILRDLEEIARKNSMSVQDAIRLFITDLQNLTNENYEKNIKEIIISGGISPSTKGNLISYLNKSIKRYKQIEKKNGQKQKQNERKQELQDVWGMVEKEFNEEIDENKKNNIIKDLISGISKKTIYSDLKSNQRNYVLKKLKELEIEEEKNEKIENEDRERKINKKWKEIVNTVNRESEETGRNKLEMWDIIAETIIGEENNSLKLNIPEAIKDEVIELIEEQTKIEGKDYFDDVKQYTQNFEFLTGFRGFTFALHGHRRFSNPEHSKMFENLISKLRKNESVDFPETEENFLKRVLSDNLINEYYGKKIIEERLNKIEKDRIKIIKEMYER